MTSESRIAAQAGAAPVLEIAPASDMVWIPGGTFVMGSDQHYPEERPAHETSVDGFWIDRYPVTNQRFARFVASEEIRVGAILGDLGLGEPETDDDGGSIGVYPLIVLSSLAACLAAFLVTLRQASPSETARPSADWRALAFVGAGVTLDVLLVEQLGFVMASTGLFWLTARAFDRSRPWRDAFFAFATSLTSYLLFTRLLQLTLPSGMLSRWL